MESIEQSLRKMNPIHMYYENTLPQTSKSVKPQKMHLHVKLKQLTKSWRFIPSEKQSEGDKDAANVAFPNNEN